jgi:hypothetical protein
MCERKQNGREDGNAALGEANVRARLNQRLRSRVRASTRRRSFEAVEGKQREKEGPRGSETRAKREKQR